MKLKNSFYLLFSLSLLITTHSVSQEFIRIPVTNFKPESLSEPEYEDPKWSLLTLPKRSPTKYSLIESEDRIAIKAESKNSASGLIYKIDIDPKDFPYIEWSWMVNNVHENGNYKSKKGDDYPARIYITFDYDKSNLNLADRITYAFIKTFTKYPVPLRSLNYIWANKAEIETIAPNAYTNWVYMIAVRSGESESGNWKTEIRNIYNDYKKAFGEEPPRINGIAIMTDSDDTKGEATAYYGDIIFRKHM